MSRRRRALTALAVIATIAPISACGSSSPAAGGTGSSTTAATVKKAVKFSRCMRSNGVSQFPDLGSSGKVTLDGVVNGSSLDPNSPAFQQAISACKDLEPAGFTGSKRSPQQMGAALRFAQCIRENGVKDFPDPVNGQPLVDTNRIPSSNLPGGMSILNAAMHKCRGVAAQAIGSQP